MELRSYGAGGCFSPDELVGYVELAILLAKKNLYGRNR